MASSLVEAVGALAALLTTAAWLPQALKTLRSRQTRDISLLTQLMLFSGIVLWLAYGVAIGSWPLIGANTVTAVLIGAILVLKLRYG